MGFDHFSTMLSQSNYLLVDMIFLEQSGFSNEYIVVLATSTLWYAL
jgi:hypothetical protein